MATQKQVFTEITESIDRCNHTLPGLIQFLKNGFKKLENASGGGGGGSEVSWTQIQATGTKIAEIEIDDVSTNVYMPAVSATQIQTTGTKIASLTIGSDTTDLYAPNLNDTGWVDVVEGVLQYRRIGEIVSVHAYLSTASTGWSTIGTLPNEVLPPFTLIMPCNLSASEQYKITTAGEVQGTSTSSNNYGVIFTYLL